MRLTEGELAIHQTTGCSRSVSRRSSVARRSIRRHRSARSVGNAPLLAGLGGRSFASRSMRLKRQREPNCRTSPRSSVRPRRSARPFAEIGTPCARTAPFRAWSRCSCVGARPTHGVAMRGRLGIALLPAVKSGDDTEVGLASELGLGRSSLGSRLGEDGASVDSEPFR
jgi:hypothetical protein